MLIFVNAGLSIKIMYMIQDFRSLIELLDLISPKRFALVALLFDVRLDLGSIGWRQSRLGHFFRFALDL